MSAKALFLDRDGTLIRDVGYPKDPDEVSLISGCAEALRVARSLGFRLVIVSNQSGVARGFFDEKAAQLVQARVADLFRADGVEFDGAYFCFHGPEDGCACRKPAPGMLIQAARDLDLDLGASIMIGDKDSDLEAGRAAGCAETIAITTTASSSPRSGSASTWSELQGLWLAAK